MTDAERIRPLELLHRTADYIGAVVCLTSTADRRRGGRRVYSDQAGARLSKLVVVVPAATSSGSKVARWRRLMGGTTVAVVEIRDGLSIDAAADLLVAQITARMRPKA